MTVTGPDGLQHVPPSLPAHAMKTFGIASPHRKVSCAEYGCENYLNGWVTIVDAGRADLVRGLRGRYRFTEAPQPGGLYEFTFEAGQPCFRASQHSLPQDGRERFIERGGDWRGNPRGDARQLRPDDWVDSFATHQDKLATVYERG